MSNALVVVLAATLTVGCVPDTWSYRANDDARLSPADAPPVDLSPAGAPPADLSPVDAPPADLSPVDAPPADLSPVDALPADLSPVDAPPADLSLADARPVDLSTAAPPADLSPDASCGDLNTSANCGACGTACAQGQSCIASVCVAPPIASLELHPTTLTPTAGGQMATIGLHVVARDASGNILTGAYSSSVALSVTAGSAQTSTLAANTFFSPNPSNVFAANNPTAVGHDAVHGDTYILPTNSNFVTQANRALGKEVYFAGIPGSTGYRDGAANQALFYFPQAMAIDVVSATVTNLYVVDKNNGVIRKVSGGQVSTFAGAPCTLCGHGTTDGSGGAARFNDSQGAALDANHNLLIADTGNSRIRRISTADASVTTLTTDGTFVANPPNPAYFASTPAVGADASGGVYVSTSSADGGGSLYRVTPTNPRQLLSSGHVFTGSLAVDSAGTVYGAASNNHVVLSFATDGTTATVAGQANVAGDTDGDSQHALLNGPMALTIDGDGTLYAPTNGSNRMRRIATPAALSLAGSGTLGDSTAADAAAVTYVGTGIAPRSVCVSTKNVAPVCITITPTPTAL